jgi:hypothetical protein
MEVAPRLRPAKLDNGALIERVYPTLESALLPAGELWHGMMNAEGDEISPPCYLVYQRGEVVGSLADLPCMIRHAEKRRGLGQRLGIRPLRPDDEVLAYTIGLRWGPTHPRRFRYEQRMALKRRLARPDRRVVGWAMQRSPTS